MQELLKSTPAKIGTAFSGYLLLLGCIHPDTASMLMPIVLFGFLIAVIDITKEYSLIKKLLCGMPLTFLIPTVALGIMRQTAIGFHGTDTNTLEDWINLSLLFGFIMLYVCTFAIVFSELWSSCKTSIYKKLPIITLDLSGHHIAIIVGSFIICAASISSLLVN